MALHLPSHIEDSELGSDAALMKDIYEVLNEAEQQRHEGAISHATRYLVELLTQQPEDDVPSECERAVCQSAYRLLEAVEDLRTNSNANLTAVSAEPEAVRDVLLTVHGHLTKLLGSRPAKISVHGALPQRGHQLDAPCQASDLTCVSRSLSEQGQRTESGLLSGDPWEGCDDIAAEDLFEWFAESLTQPAPVEAALVPPPSCPLRVPHRDLMQVVIPHAAKWQAKESPSCSSRISTVSTAASSVVGSPAPTISSTSSPGTEPSERRLASLSVGSDVMISLRSHASLASSIGLSAKHSLAASPQLPPRLETRATLASVTSPQPPAFPKTRAIPSSPSMNWRDLQVLPSLSTLIPSLPTFRESAADELTEELQLGDRERERQEASALEAYEAALDNWEQEFLIRAPLHDWEEEFLRKAAHG